MSERVTTLVILPGLDGRGVLHDELRRLLAPVFDRIETIAYPHDRVLDYAGLEAWARERLPQDAPFVLLGESFSGAVATSIAADPPPNLRGLLLSTAFAVVPATFMRMLSPLAALLPVHHTPEPAMDWLLFGHWRRPEFLEQVKASLAQVEARVLRHRMQIALDVDVSELLPDVRVPTLILSAADDAMLPAEAGRHLKRLLPDAELQEVEGPHLLLQAAPVGSTKAIRDFMDRRIV